LTEDQAQVMLAQLREHYGMPVMPVESYCAAFRQWRDAIKAAAERESDEGRKVSLAILKSNLLFRLLYLGEPLRKEPCPIHKGYWSGCVAPERECPYCMSGSNVTGWVNP